MKHPIEWIERQAIRLAFMLAPQDRAGWLAAMAAELDYVPPSRRLHFAAGCLLVAVRLRFASPGFVLMAVRCLLVAGAAGWALLNMRFAGLAGVADMPNLQYFAYTAATLFAVGGFATAWRGFDATMALAGPLLLITATSTVVLKITLDPTPVSHLLVALLVEHLVILLVAVAIAATAQQLVRARPEASQ